MIIATVLKQSAEYRPEHAEWLHAQLRGYRSVCLTDAKKISGVNTIPLRYSWPSWWAKLNLFNPGDPDIGSEDIFYIDIDTVITGDLRDLIRQSEFTALTDFYHEGKPDAPMASGVMYIPAACKSDIWREFTRNPMRHIQESRAPGRHGDQGFIGSVAETARWQDVAPGKIVSYKRDIATAGMPGHHNIRSRGNGSVPNGAAIVCFHGNPRPWQVSAPWIPPMKKPAASMISRMSRAVVIGGFKGIRRQ